MMIKRVYLEITNACNLNCPFCTNNKGQDFMELDKVNNYLTQIKEVTSYVYLHVLGEPLLHPCIEEILLTCDRLNLNVQLVTNGTLLCYHQNILNHPSLRKLSISLHSINNLKVKDEYFNIINNLIDNNNNKIIELRFYDFNNLNDKLTNYLRSLKQIYDLDLTSKKDSYKLKDNVYIYYQEMFDWPDINDPIISDKGKCLGTVDQIAILHNGLVTTCCLDSNGYNAFGDLNKNSLKEILENDEYKNIFKAIKNNELIKDLCKKCSYRLRFK